MTNAALPGDGASAPDDARPPSRFDRVTRTFSAFRLPHYRLLWVSMVTSVTGMQTQMFARGLLAYELGGAAAAIGIVALGQAIPHMLFTVVGGTFADRFDRRKLMIATQALIAAAGLIISVMVYTDVMTVTLLFLASVTMGVLTSFGGPVRQTIIPEVVGQKELMNALALNNAGMNLSRIGTPSLAGALVAVSWIDLAGLFFIQAVLYCISLSLLFFLLPRFQRRAAEAAAAADGTAPVRPRRQRQGSMKEEIVAGVRYIRTSPILITLLAMGLVPNLLGQSYQQFLPVFAKDVFGDGIDRNAGALGLMGTMSGVGALIGSLAVASLAGYKRRTLLQLASGLGYGLFLTSFAMQNEFAAALVCLVALGFVSSFFGALNSTMVMTASDPQYYGRVMSINMLTMSLSAYGTFAMGYVIDWIGRVAVGPLELHGVQVAFSAIGVVMAGFILCVTVFNPSYRRLEVEDLRSAAASGDDVTAKPSEPQREAVAPGTAGGG
jgi:MFS family permease